jgi:hypothetical protein
MANASDTVTPTNVANRAVEAKGQRRRIPMSVPRRRLETPEIPGYHLHWFKESNIPQALDAWYEFVDSREVPVNQRNVGNSSDMTGNQDLGSGIRINAGIGADGKNEQLVLMKLKEELWLEDRAAIDKANAERLGQVFRGEKILGAEPDNEDSGTRYVDRERTKALFNRRRAKA